MKEYISKEYIAKEDLIQKHTKFLAGYHRGVDLPQGMTKELYGMIDLPTVTKVDICREFVEELKEYIPEIVTYKGIPCHLWWRINWVLEEMEKAE